MTKTHNSKTHQIKSPYDWGRQLRALRKKRNMTQDRLAEISGYKAASISRWETEDRVPSLFIAFDLLQALGAHLEIVEDEETKKS